MGYYINPRTETKEQFLNTNGTRISLAEASRFNDWTGPNRVVVLMDNGFFTAAGVCYNQGELNEFTRNDGRNKLFFLVPRSLLNENVGLSTGIPDHI